MQCDSASNGTAILTSVTSTKNANKTMINITKSSEEQEHKKE